MMIFSNSFSTFREKRMELNPTKLTKTGKFAVWSNDEESDRGRDITRENTLFQMLYTSYPTSFTAFQSLQERKSGENQLTKGMKVGVLTYGEVIDMNLMHKIMEILEEENLLPSFSTSSLPSSHPNDLPTNHNLNQSQFSFYDLGSGSGKMVVAAALTQVFSHCIGIEIIENLHKIAISVKEVYEERIRSIDSHYPPISFYHNDLFQADWHDASVIYINSTCFDNEMMDRIGKHAAQTLSPGTVIITLSVFFPEQLGFEIRREFRQEMSWGMADVFIQVKL